MQYTYKLIKTCRLCRKVAARCDEIWSSQLRRNHTEGTFLRFIRENADIATGFTWGNRVLVVTYWEDLAKESNSLEPRNGQVRVFS